MPVPRPLIHLPSIAHQHSHALCPLIMDHSPLARLPPELRLVIYEHTLRADREIVISVYDSPLPLMRTGTVHIRPSCCVDRQPLSLLLTCRQTRSEARPVLFAINTWSVDPRWNRTHKDTQLPGELLADWICELGTGAAGLFKAIHICIPMIEFDRPCHYEDVDMFHQLHRGLSNCFNTEKTKIGLGLGAHPMPRFSKGTCGC